MSSRARRRRLFTSEPRRSARSAYRVRRPLPLVEALEGRTLLTYSATLVGSTATFLGTGGDTIIFDAFFGNLRHNRFTAGDPGFASNLDFDSTVPGDQLLAVSAVSTVIVDAPSPLDDTVVLGTPSVSADQLLATFDFGNFAPGLDSLNIDLSASVNDNNTIAYDLGSGGSFQITGTDLTINSGAAWTGGVAITTGTGLTTTVDVLSVFADQPLTVLGAGGTTTVNLGNAGGVQDIAADVNVDAAIVNIDNTSDTTGRVVALNAGSVTGLAPAAINLNATTLTALTIDGGAGFNTFNIADTDAGATTTINAGVDGDSFIVTGTTGELDINGGAGNESLFLANGVGLSGGSYDGGGGPNNSIDYSAYLSGVVVDLAAGIATGTGGIANVQSVTGGAGDDDLTGSAGADTLIGGEGNDTVRGGGGNDLLRGDAGNDSLVGGTGADTMLGGDNDDILVWNNGDGSDSMEGGLGFDTVEVNGAAAGDNFIVESNGPLLRFRRTNLVPFTLNIGTTEDLTVNGLGGPDTMTVDTLFGVLDITRVDLNGGDDDDTFALINGGNLLAGTIDGGAGTNTLDYSGFFGPISVDLLAGTATGTAGIANIQVIIASPFGSTLIGTEGPDTLIGGPGDDQIFGLGGDDSLVGGAGFDTIEGGAGIDTIEGGLGNDLLIGGTGDDQVFGDEDDDRLIWNPGDGSDLLEGGTGLDVVEVNGSNGTNNFGISANPIDPGRVFFDGDFTNGGFLLDIGTIEQIFTGTLDGTDTLQVDFAFGNPIPVGIFGGPGIVFDGGLGADLLRLQRSFGDFVAATETYDAFGPGAGLITLDGRSISFFGLEPVDDTVPAAQFTFNAPVFTSQEIVVVDGPTLGGVPTTQIASSAAPAGFELINLANKTAVTVNGSPSDDTLTVNNPNAGAGLTALTVNGLSGNDQIDLVAADSGIAYTLNGGVGSDTVTISAAALVAGSTYTANGGPGTDTLIIDAAGNPVTLAPGVITLDGLPPIAFSNFEAVTIFNAQNLPPTPGEPVTFTAVEGLRIVDAVVATFTDADPGVSLDNYSATINWGDGTTSAGVVVPDASDPTRFFVQGTHTYADDGVFATSVTIADRGGTRTEIVGGVPVTITTTPTVRIDIPGTANVGDAPIVSQGVPVVGTEGAALTATLVATFQTIDLNATPAGYTAVIDWGDGTTSNADITSLGTGPNGVTFEVRGGHTYADEGTYSVQVTITSAGGSTAVSGAQAVIKDGTIDATGQPVTATAGTPLASALVATFTTSDPNPQAVDYAAQIDWGDGTGVTLGTVTLVGAGFEVRGNHRYAAPGTYQGLVTIRSVGGSLEQVSFTTTVVNVTAETIAVTGAVEEVPLINVTLARLTSDGGPPPQGSFYRVLIDWGDGSAPTQGLIDTATLTIRGSHTYDESGTYPVRIVVGTDGAPSLATISTTINVADVPIVLTGRLDPASDTGISNTDGITRDNQPTFFGSSEALSIVTLTAQPVGGTPIIIGRTAAGPGGDWSITSEVALPDGTYTVTATAVDRNGVTTATTVIGTIVIDTVGPRVTDLSLDRLAGQVLTTFQDDRSGLAQRTLIDNRNFKIERSHQRSGRLLFDSLTASDFAGPTAPQTVLGVFNGGRPLRGGTFTYTVFNSPEGITDVAGNPLDGEFYGFFPSGNGVPGGDFVAIIDSFHNTVSAAQPLQGFATPNNPPGTPARGGVLNPFLGFRGRNPFFRFQPLAARPQPGAFLARRQPTRPQQPLAAQAARPVQLYVRNNPANSARDAVLRSLLFRGNA